MGRRAAGVPPLLPGHPLGPTLLLGASSLLVAGCAQPPRFLSNRVSYGTLKTSLSHLEYENQQLRTQVSQLKSENRDIENRLVQEGQVNSDPPPPPDNAR